MEGRIPKVVVAGGCYVDMAVKCDVFPQAGESVEGFGFSCAVSGPGPNRAIEAALCGCSVHLISKRGDDFFGQMIEENLISRGVNIDFLYTAQAMSTGVIVTLADSIGENSSCVSAGANRALSSDEVSCAALEQVIRSADVCLVHGALPKGAVSIIIKTANLYKTTVVLEAPIAIDSTVDPVEWDIPNEFYSVNVLIADLGDIAVMAESSAGNVHKIKFIGAELVARGLECVVIRLDSRGSFIFDRNGTIHVPGFDVEHIDNSGCADAFAGALAASCGVGDGIEEAVRFANASAALASAKFGSQDALPEKQEIIELLQKQSD